MRMLSPSGAVEELMWAVGSRAPAPNGLRSRVISGGPLKIVNARIRQEGSGISVSGAVEQLGLGSDRPGHLDITILDASGRILHAVATGYFPHTVPYAYHGIPARSSYYVRLAAPPAGSTIEVRYHAGPLSPMRSPNCLVRASPDDSYLYRSPAPSAAPSESAPSRFAAPALVLFGLALLLAKVRAAWCYRVESDAEPFSTSMWCGGGRKG